MAKVNHNELAASIHAQAQGYCKAMDRAAYGTMVVGDDLGDALSLGAQAGGQLASGNAGGAGGTLGGAAGGALGNAIGGDTGQAIGQAAGKLLGQVGGQAAGQALGMGGSSQQKPTLILMAEDSGHIQDSTRQGLFAARAGQPATVFYLPKGADPRNKGRKTVQGTWSSQAITMTGKNAQGQDVSNVVPAGVYFIPTQWAADMAGALWTAGRPIVSKEEGKNKLAQLVQTLGQKYGIAQ